MSIDLVPFAEAHLTEAAGLVAARYWAQRDLNPAIPVTFEDPAESLPLLERVMRDGPGIAAVHKGHLAGFLLAYLISLRGIRSAYSPDYGHAAEAEGRRELYRRMYAALAPRWLAHGCFQHAVTLFADETEAHDAWFSLGFGLLTVDALRNLDPVQRPIAQIEIRRATPDDLDLLAALELALRQHLATAPTFMPLIIEETRAGRERWLADSEKALWLAFGRERPVAFLCLEAPRYPVLPVMDARTVAITGAYTQPGARGGGIATALLRRALEWARTAGYERCSVDFESANILAERFWLGSGFRPVCYSVLRRVDERLTWAGANRDEADVRRAYREGTELG